jgi:transposase-like protein
MTVRDIQEALQELYGVEVSAGLISKVTDFVEEERKQWQNRPLDAIYPILYSYADWKAALNLFAIEFGDRFPL